MIVAKNPISRLDGESDILYVGFTSGSIKSRYEQETTTGPSKTGGSTNSRLTYILGQLNGWQYYYMNGKQQSLTPEERREFNDIKSNWTKQKKYSRLTVEKYILVRYADKHLELPPLNQRF